MNFVNEILSNRAVTIPLFAWFCAQMLKFILVYIGEKRLDFTRFLGSGGMPSSHSAYIVSLATVLGMDYGWDSGIFALSVAISFIVMYDAAGIRRAAGQQAAVLNKMIFSNRENKFHIEEKLKELLGHTPLEVIMGALLGIILGLILG